LLRTWCYSIFYGYHKFIAIFSWIFLNTAIQTKSVHFLHIYSKEIPRSKSCFFVWIWRPFIIIFNSNTSTDSEHKVKLAVYGKISNNDENVFFLFFFFNMVYTAIQQLKRFFTSNTCYKVTYICQFHRDSKKTVFFDKLRLFLLNMIYFKPKI
jgi:hypothetical protein